MSETLNESIGLIVRNRNYPVISAGATLPTEEKILKMYSHSGEARLQVTLGNSCVPSEVRLIGRGILTGTSGKFMEFTATIFVDEGNRVHLRMRDSDTGKEIEEVFSYKAASKSKEYSESSNSPAALSSAIRRPERRVNEEIEARFAKKNLIGLDGIKKELSALYNTFLMSEDFRRNGSGDEEISIPWNFFIGGGAGSGKHEVARIISELLYDNGMTDDKNPVTVSAIGLDITKPSEFFGQILCDGKTIVIENCDLMIPEEESADTEKLWLFIYELLQEAHRNQNCFFIFLGKSEPLEDKFRLMPKLSGVATPLFIRPYDTEELKCIALRFMSDQGLVLDAGAAVDFDSAVRREAALSGFAGAHTLERLISDAKKKKSFRYVDGGAQNRIFIDKDFSFDDDDSTTLEELLKELDGLTGLEKVKEEVKKEINTIQAEKELRLPKRNSMLHMMFLGNPGTGKTTVARLIAKIYGKLGLLPRPDIFIEVDRSALIGAYQGHTEKATREIVEKAMGGVLFIDEAHRLVSGDQDDFGKQALGVLIKNMWDYRDRFMVILAGYDNMEQILSQYEPGISRRIHAKFHFADYSQEELFTIFCNNLKKNTPSMIPDEEAKKQAQALIRERSSAPNFGNAGGVCNITDDVIQCVLQRLLVENQERKRAGIEEIDLSKVSFVPVITEDILAMGGKRSNESSLQDYEKELDDMIGLSKIKEEVRMRESQILVERERMRQGLLLSEDFFLHSIFYGNAGTGKTTVARLIAKIYNKMGVLPAGDVFVEVKRGDLVAEYMGQTAIKTRRVVESAIGGVLFIDEAYALCTGEGDEFGMEAVNTLLTLANDYKDRMMIILAGYEENMNRFLQLNQGLDRRFPNRFHFEDYTLEELCRIFDYKLKKNGRILENGTDEYIKKLIEKRSKKPGFGNAGGIDNIMKELIDAQATRLRPQLLQRELPPELLNTISLEDVQIVMEP